MSNTSAERVPVSRASAEHYAWASATETAPCDGWHLHRSVGLSVIEERMPPGAAEHRHLHPHATQFFYVIEGRLELEAGGSIYVLNAGTGVTIEPGTAHQVFNRSAHDVRFLVISQPPSHGDRVPA